MAESGTEQQVQNQVEAQPQQQTNQYSYEKKNLLKEQKRIEQIKELKSKSNILIFIIVGLLLFNIGSLFVSINLLKAVIKSEKNQALMKQEISNIRQYAQRNSAEYMSIQDVEKVILDYNYKYYEKHQDKLRRMAELIVRVGYGKYNIPVDEWLILFGLESDWNRWAKSDKGALGIAQIMEDTGRWICKELGIVWKGQDMLYDEITSIQIGMYYYKFLKEKYDENPMYYIVAYNWGETYIYPYWNAKKKIRSSYLRYWIEEKKRVEQILGRGITVDGADEKEFSKRY